MPMRSRNSGKRVFFPEASTTNSAGHHLQFAVTVIHRDTDDGIVGAVVDEVGDLGLVAEADARFVVEAATHAPLEQRPSGTDDLNVTGAGLLPGAAESDAVLGRHVDLERALAPPCRR